MAAAGYDPRESIKFWARMQEESRGGQPPEFLSTHPSHQTRIQHLKERIPEAMPLYEASRSRQQTHILPEQLCSTTALHRQPFVGAQSEDLADEIRHGPDRFQSFGEVSQVAAAERDRFPTDFLDRRFPFLDVNELIPVEIPVELAGRALPAAVGNFLVG